MKYRPISLCWARSISAITLSGALAMLFAFIVPEGMVKDQDSNTYKTVRIGDQVWMAENLRVKHFRNGDPIPRAKSKNEWLKMDNEQKPAWCYYENDRLNGEKYGLLYNWYAVNDPRGLAPEGWHIPGNKEWEALVKHLGGIEKAGAKLKATEGWIKNDYASNESGFTGLPGGKRVQGQGFSNIDDKANFWSTTAFNKTYAWKYGMVYLSGRLLKSKTNDKAYGMSVRCIKD